MWDHWPLAAIAVIALGAAAWFAPRTARTIAARYLQRREAYRRSEAWSFEQFRSAAHRGDVKAAYFALLDWLQRFAPVAPDHNLESLKAGARDAALDQEIGSIERQLFAPDRNTGNWSLVQLLRRVSAARMTLQRQAAQTETARPLPQRLNPVSDLAAPDRRFRLPAR